MQAEAIIHAFGHENILATHHSTLEITRESHLTREGDCIIAVSADKAIADLGEELRKGLLGENARVMILIEADNIVETVLAQGSPQLLLAHPSDMVVRKSGHICERTLAIKANRAAYDLSRKLVRKLRNPRQEVKITLSVRT
jgi:hypothetical protein